VLHALEKRIDGAGRETTTVDRLQKRSKLIAMKRTTTENQQDEKLRETGNKLMTNWGGNRRGGRMTRRGKISLFRQDAHNTKMKGKED